MKYGPFKMVPMITQPGVDRTREDWDEGILNFGYMEDPRFPGILLLSNKPKIAKEEALAHWRRLIASTNDKPEGFMLIGPLDAIQNHYIDDGETTGWAIQSEKYKAENVEYKIQKFGVTHSRQYGRGMSLVLCPPDGIRMSQLKLDDEEALSGYYRLTVTSDSGLELRSNVRVLWCGLPHSPEFLMGDDLLLGLDLCDDKEVAMKCLLRLVGKRVTLTFKSLDPETSHRLELNWAFGRK